MRRNDLTKIKLLDPKALQERVKTTQAELANLVMDLKMNTLKDKKAVSKKKTDIAQLLTVLNQKMMLERIESRVKNLESRKENS